MIERRWNERKKRMKIVRKEEGKVKSDEGTKKQMKIEKKEA
jgi:hypothetical protein